MLHESPHSSTADICLLLRAYAEHRWLTVELLPVVLQLEQPGALPEDQLGAALAYLEVLTLEASRRAAETDAASVELGSRDSAPSGSLQRRARDYHDAVLGLRRELTSRVAVLLAPGEPVSPRSHAGQSMDDRIRSARCRSRPSTSSRTQPTPTAPSPQPR